MGRPLAADHHRRATALADGLAEYGLAASSGASTTTTPTPPTPSTPPGFDEALVVTLDGYGSGCAAASTSATRDGVQAAAPLPRSPTRSAASTSRSPAALGFKPSRHEGKIVGLAAYGDPERAAPTCCSSASTAQDGDFRIARRHELLLRPGAGRSASRRATSPRRTSTCSRRSPRRSSRYWVEKTGLTNVVVSGGVVANVKLNQRIREIAGVERVFVYPNMGDGGCGTGAAMLAFGRERVRRPAARRRLLRPGLLRRGDRRPRCGARSWRTSACDDIEDRVAELLTRGLHRRPLRRPDGVRPARARQPLDPLPRAGARGEPVAQPAARPHRVHAVRAGDAGRARRRDCSSNLSGCENTAEFMTITFDCTDEMKRHVPGGRARRRHRAAAARQRADQPELPPHPAAYDERDRHPGVINTSFNMHEEPILQSRGRGAGVPARATRLPGDRARSWCRTRAWRRSAERSRGREHESQPMVPRSTPLTLGV